MIISGITIAIGVADVDEELSKERLEEVLVNLLTRLNKKGFTVALTGIQTTLRFVPKEAT